MPKWMKEPSWWMLIITFIIGFLGLVSAEYGPLFNRSKIEIFPSGQLLKIGQDYGSLYIDLPIDIIKTGKSDKSIFKMQLYLQRYDGNYETLFDWSKPPMTFTGALNTRIDARFIQELDNERYQKIYPLKSRIGKKLLDKYKSEGWVYKSYYLEGNDQDVKALRIFVRNLLEKFTNSKYKALLVAFDSPKSENPMWSDAYAFELTSDMIKSMVDDQIEAYDSIGDFNPKYLITTSSPIIEKISEAEKKRLTESFRNYLSKKPKSN